MKFAINIPYIIIGILLVIVLFLFFKPQNNEFDTTIYDKKITELESKIKTHEIVVDSLTDVIGNREIKIGEYKVELNNLQDKYNREKKQHEKDINRIKSMSNSDIAREFANTFK